jgi:hypothetical protein
MIVVDTNVLSEAMRPADGRSPRVFAWITVRRKLGRTTDPFDIQIAAIAKARGMAVATRNVTDFEEIGIELIDPWAH